MPPVSNRSLLHHAPLPSPPPCRFLITCYAVDWESSHVWVNSGVLAVSLIAKLPEMHGVRIMQINAARVD